MIAPATPNPQRFVDFMREAAPYLQAHRGRCFVVYLGGELVASPTFPQVMQDLALLCAAGAKLVLVHGARQQVEARLLEAGLASRLVGDLRVTDAATMVEVRQAVAEVRYAVEAQLARRPGERVTGAAELRLTGGSAVVARPIGVIDGVDLEYTGAVRKVDTDLLHGWLSHGDLVLLSPLAHSPSGELFSLNALELATHVAIALAATKLILYTRQPMVMDAAGHQYRELTAHDLRHDSELGGPPPVVLDSALAACAGGVERVHLISGELDGALLLELYTRDGVGTLISNAPFDQLRTATVEDVGGILSLIEPLEQAGQLVKRSREKLEIEIGQFQVMVREGTTIACGAVYPYPEEGTAELACIAVHPEYRGGGFGAILLNALERRAQALGMRSVFVLTTQTTHWFQELGYERRRLEDLPVTRQVLYNVQRNSVVLTKALRDRQ